MKKKKHTMAIQIQIQLQSPFSDVWWLHMTLTNEGFQNGCWPMEDMVRIWSAMTDRLMVATGQRTWGDVPFLGCKVFFPLQKLGPHKTSPKKKVFARIRTMTHA